MDLNGHGYGALFVKDGELHIGITTHTDEGTNNFVYKVGPMVEVMTAFVSQYGPGETMAIIAEMAINQSEHCSTCPTCKSEEEAADWLKLSNSIMAVINEARRLTNSMKAKEESQGDHDGTEG